MQSFEDAIVPVTGDKPGNGTAFIIHRDEQATFLLTCRHVITSLGETIYANYLPATIVSSMEEHIDLAVLRVEGLIELPILYLDSTSVIDAGLQFHSSGFYLQDKIPFLQKLRGRLAEQQRVDAPTGRVRNWVIEVSREPIRPGNSGAPVVDPRTGYVFAVITHQRDNGQRGNVLSVEAVKLIWNDVDKLSPLPSIPVKPPLLGSLSRAVVVQPDAAASTITLPIRKPSPEPPDWLLSEVAAKNVVPFIGAGLSMSALPNMPDRDGLLRTLTRTLPLDPEERAKIEQLLAVEADNEAVARLAEVGDFARYQQLRTILNPIIESRLPDSPAHTFLNALNFRRYITTNYDRLLERYLTPSYEVITSSDTDALHYLGQDAHSRFILKLHGDVSRPETIKYSEAILEEIRGKDGKNLSEAAEVLSDFLKDIFVRNTVLFLGASLSDREGFYKLGRVLAKRWGEPRRRHFAFVEKDDERMRMRLALSQALGLSNVNYEPDSEHSQLWEFISYLNTGEKPDPVPGQSWSQFFRPKQRSAYLERQLKLEQNARSIWFLTPGLSNAIATDAFLYGPNRTELLNKVHPENREEEEQLINEKTIPAMVRRRDNLVSRLYSAGLEVRVLFLEYEIKKVFATPADHERLKIIIDRYNFLLELIQETDLEMRLIPSMTPADLKRLTSSYAIIVGSEPTPFVDIAIAQASQATINFFDLQTTQINTDEVALKVVEFERLWASAWSERESVLYLQNLLAAADKILSEGG